MNILALASEAGLVIRMDAPHCSLFFLMKFEVLVGDALSSHRYVLCPVHEESIALAISLRV